VALGPGSRIWVHSVNNGQNWRLKLRMDEGQVEL
jgi:hypothetical protein